MIRFLPVLVLALLVQGLCSDLFGQFKPSDNSREVWFPQRDFPKLLTPQWVGEDGVECVVVLAIDDMREPAKYEAYLRPILQRLKVIDGRAPVSIMTCAVKPDDPQLQSWLQEGLSLECHTFDHPCPLLAGGDIAKSKATYDKCVDLMASIPNNQPVAFRMPCCDSLNTVSPRFYSEIFRKTTTSGKFLQLDSSVFTLYTADDPSIPRDWITDVDGREKFRKYVPRKLKRGEQIHDRFVNTIENYPYPYVIQNTCWEFPCMVPSDWSANHLHKPDNPDTVRDLKVALDITVQKQGVMNLVFHPHGWIKSEQVVELIDHAIATHGKKIKFLNFKECVDRLNVNVLGGRSFRNTDGSDRGLRLVDANQDGRWELTQVPVAQPGPPKEVDEGRRQVDLNGDGYLDVVLSNSSEYGAWLYDPQTKVHSICLLSEKRSEKPVPSALPLIVRKDGTDNGFFVKDRQLCWINEETDVLPDLMQQVSFDDLLGDRIPDAKSPGAAIKSMRVRPGYTIELVAHEPLTMDPVAFDWGADGKFWLAEMADYPLGIDGRGTPGGRIRYLEDTDGDGRYDKSTIFLEGVPFPNGVIAWKKGVLVSAAPDLFYAEDTNGDGQADVRQTLYSGFAEGNQQHRVNGFTRGLDNWLYLANGDSGGVVTSKKTGKSLDLRGRDLRIRPETGEMEGVAGASQFGRNRDDCGNWFGNNNSRPMWHFLLDDHYLSRNPHLTVPNLLRDVSVTPGAAPVYPSSKTMTRFNDFHTANRFTSACSAIVYRDNLLFGPVAAMTAGSNSNQSSSIVSHTFVSEPVHNLVHHEVMSADGLSFTSQRAVGEEGSEFVSSTDNWFRPTMIRTGPDGGLWISDMYRLVIEHPQWIPVEWQRKLNVRAGVDKGRVWRVLPIGSKPRPIPRLDRLAPADLVASLDSPNGWQRDLTQQLLIDQADSNSITLLRSQVRQSPNPLCRLHSLCTLDGIKGGINAELISESLTDPHPGVRRHAIRLLESLGEPDSKTMKTLNQFVDDVDPQVRLQLACSLGTFKKPEVGMLLGKLARQSSNDAYMMTAVMSSVSTDNLQQVLGEVINDGSVPADLLERLLNQATVLRHQSAVMELLSRGTKPASDGGYADWQFAAVRQFLNSLARSGESLDQRLRELGPEGAQIDRRLQSMFSAARTVAANADTTVLHRISAVRVLGDSSQDLAVLSDLLRPQQPPELQSASLEAMGRINDPRTAEILLSNYRSFGPGLRIQVCSVLLSREAWRDKLLDALETKNLASADLDPTSRQRLLVHNQKGVRDRSAKLFAVNLNTDRAKLVTEYLPIVRMGGDPQHGSQLFLKRCAQCHKLGDIGHAVGPDLMSLTDKSAEALVTAILDPNRAVEAKFMTFTAVTKAGITHSGILSAETANSVTLRAAEGKDVALLRNEIDDLQSNTKSLMPEGLERELNPHDAAALVTYIRQNVPLPIMKSFPGNAPRVVQADAEGTMTLTPFDAEVYGPTIVIEEQQQNLGWWSSSDDIVVWTINVPRGAKYTVSWTWACDPQAAGNSMTVEALGRSFTRKVGKTNGWEDYQTIDLGELELPAGEVRLTIKPASRPLPALADVKSVKIRLSP
jgi:putative membrane-bound dehydrogenase-like protein